MEIVIGCHVVQCDDTDWPALSAWRWQIHKTGGNLYARGYLKGSPRGGPRTYMHRLIADAKRGEEIDHRNGDGLDNRRGNLRRATRSENNANRYRCQGATTHKGVHFDRITGRYRAEIRKHGVRFRLGRFDSAEEASAAYDRKARELFPEFGHGSQRSDCLPHGP